MDEKKFMEVGSKLNINSSDIKIRKGRNNFIKILYPFIPLFTLCLSAISGLISGIFENNNPSYPYNAHQSNSYVGGVITVSVINIGSGLITIPNKRFKLNILVKIGIFLGTFILSRLLFEIIFSYFDSNLGNIIMYNVYKKENS